MPILLHLLILSLCTPRQTKKHPQVSSPHTSLHRVLSVHVFVALVLQQTPLITSRSCLTSFQLTGAACQAPVSDAQEEGSVLIWPVMFYCSLFTSGLSQRSGFLPASCTAHHSSSSSSSTSSSSSGMSSCR